MEELNIINGTAGNDSLDGSGSEDSLIGGAGDDILLGRSGGDTLEGGEGDDFLDGGANSDLLVGGAGNDTLSDLSGRDTLEGGDGDDSIDGGSGTDGTLLAGSAGNDTLRSFTGNQTLEGGDGDDLLDGGRDDDSLFGGAGNDILGNGDLLGNDGDDLFFGDIGADTITGGEGANVFAYAGDPFEGEDVSAPERQIIGGEDFITDFDFDSDTYRLNAVDFSVNGNLSFAAVDANDPDASIAPGTNVVALLNSDNDSNPDTPFLAGTAANQIAELTSEDGAGFFVYFNSELEVNRLVYSTNLNDANADLKIVSRQTNLTGQDAIDALQNFSADNFEFEGVQLAEDADGSELVGTAGNDVINGSEGSDTILGLEGSDTITSGDGADILAYEGDPFEGQLGFSRERQIIGGEDFVTDFDFDSDTYRFNAFDFDLGFNSQVNFAAVDANDPDASIAPGTNVVALLNSDNDSNPDTPFLAGTAANQIAELTSEDGAGFFVYFNSELEVNRLVYSTNLNDANADLKIVSRQTDLTGQDAIDALQNFSADNFEFEVVENDLEALNLNEQILGDENNNELNGTTGNDLIDGGGGNDTLFGDTGGDVFLFSDNYFRGIVRDVDEQDFTAEQADTITDFNIEEDIIGLNPNQFSIGEIRFANQAAGDPVGGANIFVRSPEEVENTSGPIDTSSGLIVDVSRSTGNVTLTQYFDIEGNRQGSLGRVVELEGLSADDLSSFTADNFILDDFSEASFM